MVRLAVWGEEILYMRQGPFTNSREERFLQEQILLAIAQADRAAEQQARIAFAAWLRKFNTPEAIRRAEQHERMAQPN